MERFGSKRASDHFALLDDAFAEAIAPWHRTGTPVVVLFSGGVDSGLLGWELRESPGLVLSTMGTRDSPDLRIAAESAGMIGARWVPSEVGPEEVRATADRLAPRTAGLSRTTRSVLVAFALAVELAPPGPVLCGQGVDELFLGYAHFRGLPAAAAAARSDADLKQLLERDWPLSQRIAEDSGRSVVAPYLHPEFVRAAQDIPIDLRHPDPTPKAFFRHWALRHGLPAAIADRPKRALQFGSGIDRLVPRSGDSRAGSD